MNISRVSKLLLLALTLMVSRPLLATQDSALLSDLQTGWAEANYQLSGDAQVSAFETLIQKGEDQLDNNPNDTEIQIWTGIIKSSLAGAKGGLGALGLAKQAKAHLETAIEQDGTILSGSAYTSLGVLYSSVPGWPIGFGDKKKADKNMLKALQLNPTGIDPNYFYGDFLLKQKNYQGAKQYFEKALAAKPRPGREVADKGRRAEIRKAMVAVEKHL